MQVFWRGCPLLSVPMGSTDAMFSGLRSDSMTIYIKIADIGAGRHASGGHFMTSSTRHVTDTDGVLYAKCGPVWTPFFRDQTDPLVYRPVARDRRRSIGGEQ